MNEILIRIFWLKSEPVLEKGMGFFVFKYLFEKMRSKNSKVNRLLKN
jgi:hypothetical protein